MEVWDIYNRERIRTGEYINRGAKLEADQYHLVVHVCIFNQQDKLLLQQRQSSRERWPSKWDLSVGGSALAGEDSRAAAERETAEELGLQFDFSEERPFFTVNFKNGFDDFYLIEAEVDISDLLLQEEEVGAVRWVDYSELLELRARGELIPYHRGLLDMLFEMRKFRGAHAPGIKEAVLK